MGRLVLVRHGQASFLATNYDQLSPLGVRQAARLGEVWAQQGVAFDRVVSGTLERQKDTAAEVAQAYARAGAPLPTLHSLAAFDEYDGDAVMRIGLPVMLERNAELRTLYAAFKALPVDEIAARHLAFQRVFEVVLTAWVRGETDGRDQAGNESWAGFCARVHGGLDQLLSHRGESIVVFTSGGVIAVAMQRALGLTPETTLQLSFMSRNASASEFLFSGKRFTLSSFNVFQHFEDPAMLTYR